MQAARKTLISVPRFASSSRCILQASFSTSVSSRMAAEKPAPTKSKAAKKATALSSCPAGTVMTGLSIMKDQPDPVAKPDEEYPAWLWTLLDPPAVKQESDGPRDFVAEKKQLRAANRTNIKAQNYLKTT